MALLLLDPYITVIIIPDEHSHATHNKDILKYFSVHVSQGWQPLSYGEADER